MITPGLLPSRLLALSCSCGSLEFLSFSLSLQLWSSTLQTPVEQGFSHSTAEQCLCLDLLATLLCWLRPIFVQIYLAGQGVILVVETCQAPNTTDTDESVQWSQQVLPFNCWLPHASSLLCVSLSSSPPLWKSAVVTMTQGRTFTSAPSTVEAGKCPCCYMRKQTGKQTGRQITAQQSSICQTFDRNIAQPNIWLLHKSQHLTLTSLSGVSN